MKIKGLILLLLCACLFTAGAVQAAPGASSSGPMVVEGNKLYVVTGSTLACIDISTKKIISKIDLSQIGVEQAEALTKKNQQDYLKRMDKNGDGVVTEDETNKHTFKWMDKNQDGKIMLEEVPAGRVQPLASYGQATLLINGGKVYMLRNGNVFLFNAASLAHETSIEVAPAGGSNRGGYAQGFPGVMRSETQGGKRRR